MIEMIGILILIDVVDYTTQSVALGTQKTKDFTNHFEEVIRSMAKSHNAYFIKTIGDAALLFFEGKPGFQEQFIDFTSQLQTASCSGVLDKFDFKCILRMISHFGIFHFEGSGESISDFIGPEGIQVFRIEKFAGEHEIFAADSVLNILENSLIERKIHTKKVFDGPLKGFKHKIRIYKLYLPEENKEKGKYLLYSRMEELKKNCQQIPVFGNYRLMRMEDNFINLEIAQDHERTAPAQGGAHQGFRFKTPGQGMDSISTRERFKDFYDMDEEQELKESAEQGSIKRNVEILYEKVPRGMIFGLPGSGKTTTLNYFAFREFQYNKKAINSDDKRLVMFISCQNLMRYGEWFKNYTGFYGKKRHISRDSVESCLYYFLHEFLFQQTPPKLKRQVQKTAREILSAFYRGKLTLLVDALDEAHSTDTKEGILNALRILFRECLPGKNDGNRIYITARFSERNRALVEEWQEFKEPIFRVRSLDMEQLRQMAEYLYGDNKTLYKAFSDAVWQNEIAAKVGGTPLTALLMLVYFEGSRTFDTRFEMYHVLMMFILSRAWKHIKDGTFKWDLKTFFENVKNGNIFAEEPFKESRGIYDALSLLAYNNIVDEIEDVREKEILTFFLKFAADLVGPDKADDESKKWLRQLKEDQLLIPAGFGEYVFIHRTVMDYLAARFIKEKLKNSGFHQDKFSCDSPPAAIMKGKEFFFQSEMIPIAVGSGIDTGASLLGLLKNRVLIETEERLTEILYLSSLKCLAEWESYFDRQYRQMRQKTLQSDMIKKEKENEDAVAWIYTYVKEMLEGSDKNVLKTLIDKYREIPHLTRPILMNRFLSAKTFFSGDSESISSRKELLERFISGQQVRDWFKQHEESGTKTENKPVYSLNSNTYHPDDKNIDYYRQYTGSTLWGLLGSPNFKHNHCITCVIVSQDGKTVVSGSDDRTLKWWDMESGKEIHTFKGHTDYIKCAAFSPDGKILVSGSDDKTIKWWDLESGNEIKIFTGHQGPVNSIAFTLDCKTMVSGSGDAMVKCWDIESGKEIQTFRGHERPINSIAISPDGKTLVSASNDKTLKWWDLASGREIQTFMGHTDHVKSVVFSPDGQTIISASWDKTIKFWDLKTEMAKKILKGHNKPINSIDISPDGKTLVSASWDNSLKWWDLETGKEKQTLIGHMDQVRSVAFTPIGKIICSGGRDATIRCWNLESGKEIKTFSGHEIFVNSIAFSPDGKTLISGARDYTLRWWDLESGKEKKTFTGHQDHVTSVCFCPDGKTVISGSFDETLKWWDLESSKVIQTFKGHEYGISAVCISPDGKTVLSGSFDSTLKSWNLESGKIIKNFKGHLGYVWSIDFSPDGKTIVSGSDDKTLKYWDVESGEIIKTLEGHQGYVYSVKFHPNDQTVVSGASDHTLKYWDLHSGQVIREFKGHGGIVWSVVFSPCGKYIISCSWDDTIKIWNRETGKCIATVPLLWRPKEIKPSPMRQGFYACANGNGTIALFDFSENMNG